MSSGNPFHRPRASGKKECWYAEVLAHGIVRELLLIVLCWYGVLFAAIGASGNSIIFLMILNKWQSFIRIRLVFNEGHWRDFWSYQEVIITYYIGHHNVLATRDDVLTSMGRASANPTQVKNDLVFRSELIIKLLWLTRGSGNYG